jgi:hypothetical protein
MATNINATTEELFYVWSMPRNITRTVGAMNSVEFCKGG